MRKITALYINEMLKISKKVSVIVILAIMIVGTIGFGVLMKTQRAITSNIPQNEEEMSWVYDEMNNQIQILEGNIASLQEQLKNDPNVSKAKIEMEINNTNNQIEMYKLAIEKKIPMLISSDFRSEALNTIMSLKNEKWALEQIPEANRTPENIAALKADEALISRYLNLINNQDFKDFLSIKNDQIQADTSLTDDQKKIEIENNELWYKLDPSGGLNKESGYQNVQTSLNQIKMFKLSLLYNLDYSYGNSNGLRPLSPDDRSEMENQLAVMTYRLENKMSTNNYDMAPEDFAVQGMFGFGSFMIVILMMILAGSAVSQEIATGSIKSLIISPTRRWKIFTAKLISLFSVSLLSVALLYLVVIITNGLLFGFNSGEAYVFAIGGKAGELNFYLFKLLELLAGYIDIIVYMVLAFMLSIITRNTAAAVGISIAVYFGGSIANAFVSLFAKGEWLKFIPFNNLGLTADFFPFDTTRQAGNMLFGVTNNMVNPTLTFSLIYLAVLLICMGYTALDSFCRRDIK